MISFNEFRMEDGSPIYLQILTYIRRGIIAGTICDGDELPSRRVLSTFLGVNPNTIQKAYRILEEEGIVSSHTGAKSVIVICEEKKQTIRKVLLEEETINAVKRLKQMGVTMEETLVMIQNHWNLEE